jgi:hypothetical protein
MGYSRTMPSRLRPPIVMALLALATTAHADETEEAAQVHLDRGVAAFHAGEYPRAHREFEAAHELAPDRANPYRWLALTEIQLGQCPRALGNIDAFLARVSEDDERIAELVRLRGMCVRITTPRETAPATPAAHRPITHRWWFWTAVAGAAAAVAGTIVVVASDDDRTILPPIHCDDAGCGP